MIGTKKEIFQKLEFNLKRIIRIIENLKSIKQSLIIHKIYTNLNDLIPSGTVFSERNDIKKFLSIYTHFREEYLITEANLIGQDLLNILMYIHAIVQSSYAKKALHYFVNNYNINKFKKKEINKVSKLNSIIPKLDYYLISSLEFLLKKCQNITTLRDITNPREIAGRVIDFIKIYWSYLIECNNMLLLDSPELKEMKIHFNENLDFFFEIEYKSNIFYDRGQKLFEIYNTPEFDDKDDQTNYYNALKEDFGYLDDFWYDKFGYRISKLIDVIEEFSILPITMLEQYYAPFDKMTPVINVSNLKGKSINTIQKMFENYLYKIILPYFKKPIFRGTILSFNFLTDLMKFNEMDLREGEGERILSEITAKPEVPFNTYTNNLANRIFYPISQEKCFFWIQGLSGALRERLYIRLTSIDEHFKEHTLVNHIKRICERRGYRIHPFSGVKMRDHNKKTLGDVDIIAIKNDTLIIIESKIIPHKKVDVARTNSFNDTLKSISKEITDFDKNIKHLETYGQDAAKIVHFLCYEAGEPLDLSAFKEIKYYFITPYLIYQPPYYKVSHNIEMITPYLLEVRLLNLGSYENDNQKCS